MQKIFSKSIRSFEKSQDGFVCLSGRKIIFLQVNNNLSVKKYDIASIPNVSRINISSNSGNIVALDTSGTIYIVSNYLSGETAVKKYSKIIKESDGFVIFPNTQNIVAVDWTGKIASIAVENGESKILYENPNESIRSIFPALNTNQFIIFGEKRFEDNGLFVRQYKYVKGDIIKEKEMYLKASTYIYNCICSCEDSIYYINTINEKHEVVCFDKIQFKAKSLFVLPESNGANTYYTGIDYVLEKKYFLISSIDHILVIDERGNVIKKIHTGDLLSNQTYCSKFKNGLLLIGTEKGVFVEKS